MRLISKVRQFRGQRHPTQKDLQTQVRTDFCYKVYTLSVTFSFHFYLNAFDSSIKYGHWKLKSYSTIHWFGVINVKNFPFWKFYVTVSETRKLIWNSFNKVYVQPFTHIYFNHHTNTCTHIGRVEMSSLIRHDKTTLIWIFHSQKIIYKQNLSAIN